MSREPWTPRTPAQLKKLPLVDAALYSLEEYAKTSYQVCAARERLNKALQLANEAFDSHVQPYLTQDGAFIVPSVRNRKRINRILDSYFNAQARRERAGQIASDAQSLVERLAGRFDMLEKGPNGLRAFRTRPDLLAEATRDELRDVVSNFKGAGTVLRKSVALCDEASALYLRFYREAPEVPALCIH